LLAISISCNNSNPTPTPTATATPKKPWAYEGISEIKRGDIIVIPNVNILPGTSVVPNGYGFGHAAFVLSGAVHKNPDSILANIIIIESIASKVPVGHQIREIEAYAVHESPMYNSNRFRPERTGIRYRLRFNFTESQIDSIIHFLRDQRNDYSNWNAMKRFQESETTEKQLTQEAEINWADNSHWYCSLLVWQSILYVTGVDLDPNGGYYVYPNDLINSPYFNNIDNKSIRRTRF